MKSNNFSIRAVAAIGALCGAITLPAISHAAGAVSVNGTTQCASSASMSLTPAGDIAITCGASGPPACSISPGTSNIGVGQTATLNATCNPAANTYAWTTSSGGPLINGMPGAVLTFPTAGTFSYTVTGTNAGGTGLPSNVATVNVTSASVAPTCIVAGSPQNLTAGGSANLTASCTPAATGYAWTVNNGGPAIGNASGATPTFSTAGAYTYTVVGSNNMGAGPVSNAVTINVAAASGCTATATGSFAGNGIKNIAIDRGGFVSYALPAYSAPGRTLEILSIQSTSSQADLTSEFSISACPGNFDTVPAECKTWGTVNQSGTQLFATTSYSPVGGTCTLIVGTQYYINVRNTRYDRVTPACTPQTCYMILQLNSY